MKKWVIHSVDSQLSAQLGKETGIHPICCDILVGRGIDTAQAIKGFFDLGGALTDPFAFRDMDKAVDRVRQALDEGEKIAVYGDYDCDGITATAILYHYLDGVGGDVIYHIPDRESEGYGLNESAVRLMAQHHINLIITVDNGISALEEIKLANELGMDVVVTDHHRPRDQLPAAVAVVDPHRVDCGSGCTNFCGAGVAFKLICGLEGDNGEELLPLYSDLLALGTLADVMELSGENRVIVQDGIQRLQSMDRVGLAALLQAAGLAGKTISSESVVFGLCPRINATGRMGNAGDAVELLLCEDEERAAQLANELNVLNGRRKQMEEDILLDVYRRIQENPALVQDRLVVIAGEGWHHGVIGIVAARILERYDKPTLILSIENGEARGSARSVEGFSIIQAISHCGEKLKRYGGHPQAAGVTLAAEELPDFTRQLQQYAAQRFPEMPFPAFLIDRPLAAREVTVENALALAKLEPFGEGNPQPVFVLRDMVLAAVTPVGQDRFVRLSLRPFGDDDTKSSLSVICFSYSPQTFPFAPGDQVDVAVTLSAQLYEGETRVNVKLAGIRLAGWDEAALGAGERLYDRYRRGELGLDETASLMLSRDEIAVLYRYLKEQKGYPFGLSMLCARMLSRGLSCAKTRICVDVLAELSLVTLTYDRGNALIGIVEHPSKKDLSTSKILAGLLG